VRDAQHNVSDLYVSISQLAAAIPSGRELPVASLSGKDALAGFTTIQECEQI
jgi:hypothetical protein